MYSSTSDLRGYARGLEALALATFVLLFFIVNDDGPTPWVISVNLAAFYVLVLRAITVPDRILPWLPSYFSIEILFFTLSYLVFYHPYQLFLLGAADLSVSEYVNNSFVDGSNKAITLATVGMLAFAIGYRVMGHGACDAAAVYPSRGEPNDYKNTARYFGAMATASSVLLLALAALYVFAGWHSAGEGRYTKTTTDAVGIEGISDVILMFCMILAALWVFGTAAKIRTPPILVVGLGCATAWTVRLLILGDRSSFLLFALVLVGGYFTFVRRASLVVVIAGLGIWILVYNVIEALRDISNWYSASDIWELLQNSKQYQDSSGESSFNITTITLRASVEMVPNAHDYVYGFFKIIQLSSAIPFSAKLYLPYLNPEYMGSAEMLTDVIVGPRASWSVGTNVVSDAYVEFGVAGVVVILFAIGWFANAIRNYVARDPHDAQRVVMYLLTMASFAELPRYDISSPLRLLVWALVFSLLIRAVAGRVRSRAN